MYRELLLSRLRFSKFLTIIIIKIKYIVLCNIAGVYLRFITIRLCVWVELCSIGNYFIYMVKRDFVFRVFKCWMRCYYHFCIYTYKDCSTFTQIRLETRTNNALTCFIYFYFIEKCTILFLIRHFQTRTIMINK